MPSPTPIQAFAAEAEQLSWVSSGFTEQDWQRPSTCPPWRVRDLFGHVHIAVSRVEDMLAEPAPEQPQVSAAEYYRPDDRFSAAATEERVRSAVEHAAAYTSDEALAAAFDHTWRRVHGACAQQPADRTVQSRFGDAMALNDFLITRVVELVVHGIDFAQSLDRPPWTTGPGGAVVQQLLLGSAEPPGLDTLGWDRSIFLAKATGRSAVSLQERTALDAAGVTWLTLG